MTVIFALINIISVSLSHSSPSMLFATHREINASPSFPTNFANALLSFDINSDGVIDYQEFLMMEKRFPIIMFPAFRLQDNLQRGTLGQCVSACVCVCAYERESLYVCGCVGGGCVCASVCVRVSSLSKYLVNAAVCKYLCTLLPHSTLHRLALIIFP